MPAPLSKDLAAASDRLLREAAETLQETRQERGAGPAQPGLPAFVQIYREWIILERSELGTQQEQAAQWQMLVHCMVSAPTLREALEIFMRFTPIVWGARAPAAFTEAGKMATLVFNEPYRAGAEGLIAAFWMLSLLLRTIEFLVQAPIAGARGRVRHADCLPEGVARLLFDAPLDYDGDEVALLLPRQDLRRPVLARAHDLPLFFAQLLPLTLGGARSRPEMRAMVEGLIRDHKQGPDYRDINRQRVAQMLGVSEATLRRCLEREGTTFRDIRDRVYHDLACGWLERREGSVADIAARLGFSDGFAFRRFFIRMNGCTPSAARRRANVA